MVNAPKLQDLQEPGASDRTGDRYCGIHAGLTGEMICADFLAGAHIENGNPKILLFSMLRLFRFLPAAQRQEFLQHVAEAA